MTTLYLRNVPPEVDELLSAEASARGISKNQQAIDVLRRGLRLDLDERRRLVREMRARRRRVSADIPTLIREGRGGD